MTPGQSRVSARRLLRSAGNQISKPDKTSLVIDRKKGHDAKKILGTRTLAETVERARRVIWLAARRRLLGGSRRARSAEPADVRKNSALAGRRGVLTSRIRAHGIAARRRRLDRARRMQTPGLRSARRSGRASLLRSESCGVRRPSRRLGSAAETPLDANALSRSRTAEVTLAATVSGEGRCCSRAACGRSRRAAFRAEPSMLHYDRHFAATAIPCQPSLPWHPRLGPRLSPRPSPPRCRSGSPR